MTTKDKLLSAIVTKFLFSELCLFAVGVWYSHSQPFPPHRSHSNTCCPAPPVCRFLPRALYQTSSFALRISPSCTFTPSPRSSLKAACPELVPLLISFSPSGFCTHLESIAASVMLPRSQCSAASMRERQRLALLLIPTA